MATYLSKTFIHNASEADSSSEGIAKDVKTYMDANAPVANGTANVTSAGIGNNRVLTLVVIQTA